MRLIVTTLDDARDNNPYILKMGVMTELWDTFGLFQQLLNEFSNSLKSAKNLRTSTLVTSLAENIAIVGFVQSSDASEWSKQHLDFIASRLQGELSPSELSWYDECAESISVFACLALGALLGKLLSGQIDKAGFALGDAHLAGFLALHNEEICAHYCT